MRKLKPSLFLFGIALLASLGVHLPVYEALGKLAEILLAERPSPAEPTTIEFELADHDEEAEPQSDDGEQEPEEQELEQKRPPPPREVAVAAPTPRRVEVQPLPAPPAPAPPEPREESNKLAVTQKSDDPDVEPPPDARFIAEEARRVEQETVARQRNLQVDEEPEPGHGAEQDESADNEGDHDETDVAEVRDVRGSDDRAARPEEREQPQDSHRESAGVVAGATAPQRPAPPSVPERRPRRAPGSDRTGGEPEPVVIDDGFGTFVVRRSVRGRGPEDDGAPTRKGERGRRQRVSDGARGRAGADLRVSWSQFEDAFGQENLRRIRQAQVAQRRSRVRGHTRAKRWRRFKSAIENYVPNVRPGNQTALNASASSFAAYLARIHRRIHREFALGFLRGLPLGGGPFDDMTLRTKLEIVINPNGSLHKVGVVETSGFTPFDFGAFNAVMSAGPFSAPPRKILSGDGRVYMHWAFYRNHRQCGTFNASPFKLKGPVELPGALPADPSRDVVDDKASESEMGMNRGLVPGKTPARPGEAHFDHFHPPVRATLHTADPARSVH
ncbi:MAG: TonB C-terminal domain-containing protein [Myxococcales bacterium]|nr:TonB C-terminal domain-containing protein [Myxococcales bacterium]MDD9968491.1 TonB C-terminal domain-containing protein [Myxococcales bacterium]